MAVLVQFDEYEGPSFLSETERVVPIVPGKSEWFKGGRNKSRTQLPLSIAFAITIHKSQGKTISKAVVDVGDKSIALGAAFVAISRLKSLDGLVLISKSMDRYTKKIRKPRMFERLNEEIRLRTLHHHHRNNSTAHN